MLVQAFLSPKRYFSSQLLLFFYILLAYSSVSSKRFLRLHLPKAEKWPKRAAKQRGS